MRSQSVLCIYCGGGDFTLPSQATFGDLGLSVSPH